MGDLRLIHNENFRRTKFKPVNTNESHIVNFAKELAQLNNFSDKSIETIHSALMVVCKIRSRYYSKFGKVKLSKIKKCGTKGDENNCRFEFFMIAGNRKIPTLRICEYKEEFRTDSEIERIQSIEGFNDLDTQ